MDKRLGVGMQKGGALSGSLNCAPLVFDALLT